MILIGPSLLSCNFLKLEEEIKLLEKASANFLHIDVMDGHFVPNLTMGPVIIKAIKKVAQIPLDVHLMIKNPERYIKNYIEAGADNLIIHIETVTHLDRALANIKENNIKAGISLNPATTEENLKYIIDYLDIILVMSVNPGFSGQNFINNSVRKINNIKNMLDKNNNKRCLIAVDGGIDNQTIKSCYDAGARVFVSGSYIFAENNYGKAIKSLREAVI